MHFNRLAKFLRSVIPADPVQLLFIFGVVCFTISPRSHWGPLDGHASVLSYVYGSNGDRNRTFFNMYTFIVLGNIFITFASIMGYFNLFRPGKRPLFRILWSMVLPVSCGLAITSCSYLYFGCGIRTSILEPYPFASVHFATIWKILLQLGPGFRIAVMGLGLILLFASRMLFKIAELPVSLPNPINLPFNDDRRWSKYQIVVLFIVSPLLYFVTNIPLLLWLATPFSMDSKVTLLASAAISFVVAVGTALWILGRTGYYLMHRYVRLPAAKYLVAGLSFAPVIYGAILTLHFLYERAHWTAYEFGRFDPPQFWQPYAPNLWQLMLIIPAFAEELIFRGFLQWKFTRRYGLWRGIFLVSLAWAASHFFSDYRGQLWYGGIALSILSRIVLCLSWGFVLSWLTLKSNSIWPATLAHAFGNFLTATAFGPDFPRKSFAIALSWAILACILFRYWPVPNRELRASEPVVMPHLEPIS